MNLREKIDSHEYLYLWEISEPEVNVLRMIVDEAKASNDPKVEIPHTPFMGNPIVSDETCRRYEITFPSYVAYAVLNESFAKVDDYRAIYRSLLPHLFEITFSRLRWRGHLRVG